MNNKITAVHFKTDRKLELFINEKIDKLGKKYDNIVGSEVILKLENTDKPENKSVDIKVFIKGNDIFASKTEKTFEEATDSVVDAIGKQLKKYKEKTKGI